ncbi:MAG: DNA polymerase III subunit delta' [Deltaproteobacteria bacterium]|nr:DNA polymerase III subunit delta' [Deltaproteobacteria bacterium]
MPFDHIQAQPTAVETLTRALRSGLVHHAYRFEGLPGVGKELAALALAQALLCAGGDVLGCGRCDACRRVAQRSAGPPAVPLHPDVVIVERGLYAPEAIGKDTPEKSHISVHQVRRVVLARVVYPPHEGRALVFIVRAADELHVSAANALLKTLEEPRPGVHFLLLTSRPERLLGTIRSRSLPVRFGPLPDRVIESVLREQGVEESRIAAAVELAGGSASAALAAAEPALAERRERFLQAVREAVAAPDAGRAVELGEAQEQNRERVRADLAALGASLARRARSAVASEPAQAEREARRYRLVAEAMDGLERNASTNLSVASLVLRLRGA